MKKILSILTLIMGLFVLSACNSNTPSAVAEKAAECIKNKDYAGYVDLIYYKEGKAPTAEEKQQVADMLKAKAEAAYDKKEGIKSAKAESEEISEDGKEAVVKMKVEFNNGEVSIDTMRLKKDAEGQWRLSMGK